MVTLPLWAVFAVSFGSPLLSFAGVLVSQALDRRSARELEHRSRREETMRVLRWAAELATSRDVRRVELGSTQLQALGSSQLLDPDQRLFVTAALDVVVGPADDVVEQQQPADGRGVASPPGAGRRGR